MVMEEIFIFQEICFTECFNSLFALCGNEVLRKGRKNYSKGVAIMKNFNKLNKFELINFKIMQKLSVKKLQI
jgi:NADPH-dependent 7-cyano-7-deazaguanine reductase QueF